MSRAWFPVPTDQINSPEFKALTAREKLQYWLLASEFNYWGEIKGGILAKSDMWFAVALSVSEIQVRTTRKKFKELGWIEFKSGNKLGKVKFSTEYHLVKWSSAPQVGDGIQFADMHKHAFNVLLKQIQYKKLSHDDVMIYVHLYFWFCIKRRGAELADVIKDDEFFITKKDFVSLVGSDKYLECVKRLHDGFEFGGGSRLFKIKEEHRRLVIQRLAEFSDPVSEKSAKENWDKWYSDIDNNVAKKQKEKQQKSDIKAKNKTKTIKKPVKKVI